MRLGFRFTPGLVVFPVLALVSYYGLSQPEFVQYAPLSSSLVVLFGLLTVSSFFSALGIPALPYIFRGLAVAGFVYEYPNVEPFNPTGVEFQFPLAFLIVGVILTKSVEEVPRKIDLLVRGIGLFIVFYSVSELLNVLGVETWISSFVFYIGFVPLLTYIASFIGALLGSDYVEKRAKGVALGLSLLFGYVWGRRYIMKLIPEWAPFIDIAVFSILVGIALLVASNLTVSKNIEPFLVGEWKKHEARIKIQEDQALKGARKLIEEFVIRKNKLPLLAYVSYYGSRVVGNSEELSRLIEPLVEYSPTSYSSLTPGWLVKKYEKLDMERRIEVVEKIIRGLSE